MRKVILLLCCILLLLGASACGNKAAYINCSNCGESISNVAAFCSKCGIALKNNQSVVDNDTLSENQTLHSHIFEKATCTTPEKCACGEIYGSALGHSWTVATCTTPKTCSTCGVTDGSVNGHSWKVATCTAPKTCSVCKKTEGSPLGHSLVDGKCSKCEYVEKTPAEKIYEQCSPAVAYIELYNSKNEAIGSGSGFFITSNGRFVTCYHVIDGASSAKVKTKDGKTYNVAGVYDFSKENDWAVLKVEGNSFDTLKIGDPSEYSAGSDVYAIGSPLGLTDSISSGIISNLNREYKGTNYIQTTASISNGSSGGALINKNGNVIGITAGSFVDGQSLNLAVPMTYVNTSTDNPLKKLSEIEKSVMVEDPIQLLKDFLVKYGVVDAITGTVVVYSLEIKDANGITYSCEYALNSGWLFIEKQYVTQYSEISTNLYFYGAGTNEVAAKAVFHFYDTFYNKWKDGYAFVFRENITSVNGIEFYSWDGDADLSQQTGEILFYRNILDIIDAADYMFDYYGLPITMKDFGYMY